MDFKYKVVIDGFGGDNSPNCVVKAAVMAVNNIKNLKVFITGKEDDLNTLLSAENYNKESIEVINASEIITNNESPTVAIKQKENSSLVVAFNMLRTREDIIGLVSAGSTGAVLTGGFLKLGRMQGVSRPALAPLLPTKTDKKVCLIDCGANVDTRPKNLCHFALMGVRYMESLGVKNPKVALLNVGTEDHKGNELTHKTFEILKQLPINFVGNMEARDALSGEYDIIVSDGFAGNVLLKSIEGTALFVTNYLKDEIKQRFWSKIGALFMKPAFGALKAKLNYNQYGGSVFLGTKKLVVKAHGSSQPLSLYNCIKQVIEAHDNNLLENIKDAVGNLQIEFED